MVEPSPADELRAAAERLRYLLHPDGMPAQIVEGWTTLPYPAQQGVVTVPGMDTPILAAFWGGVANYCTAMQPAVGSALADWLEHFAATKFDPHAGIQVTDRSHEMALAVARAINTDQQFPHTSGQQQRTVPGRPTPRLIRDLLEGGRAQGLLCNERIRLRNGTTVACTKQVDHPSPWHRRGAHSWKVVFGDAHAPHIPGGRKADELGTLRVLARDWRTALQNIAQQCRTCCTACDAAEAALAQYPDTTST